MLLVFSEILLIFPPSCLCAQSALLIRQQFSTMIAILQSWLVSRLAKTFFCQMSASGWFHLAIVNGAWRVPKWRLPCILSAHIHLLWEIFCKLEQQLSLLLIESLARITLVRSGGSFLCERPSVGRKPSWRTSSWQYGRNINQRVLFCRTVIHTRLHHG